MAFSLPLVLRGFISLNELYGDKTMPKTTRDWAKRKLMEADNNIDWASYHLREVVEKYNVPHPEIAQPLLILCLALSKIQEQIREINKSF